MQLPHIPPSPVLLFEALNGFQKTAALKAAIELDLFTAIADGASTPAELAAKTGASERGARILSDFLVVAGFLTKSNGRYSLSPDSAFFLTKRSPAYMGGTLEFLLSPTIVGSFSDLTAVVRQGGTALGADGTLAPEHEVWERFARAMTPMMGPVSANVAKQVLGGSTQPMRVLDVAASHGLFGLTFAQQNPHARVTGLDWANVLKVAQENASRMGLADRYNTIAGSMFEVDLGGPYDVILLPNILHHFDEAAIVKFCRRLKPTLKPEGRVVTVEFVPNEDRISPPTDAAFALTMLASTPSGDAYTFAEYDRMFKAAGFGQSEIIRTPGMPHSVIVTQG
jgi:ubiquinone/menaquinone biosynthesis C-methylase UbiE